MSTPQFIFGGNTGVASPKELKRLRALAEALAGPARAPQNVGEGLAAIGDALLYRSTMKKADAMEKEGEESANKAFSPILDALSGKSAPASSGKVAEALFGNPGAAAEMEAGKSGGGSYRDAIASIESAGSGDYSAVGPANETLGRPLGRYQIMEANVGPWSREALGREVTPDEFLKDPALQDKVFDHKFQGYVEKYGPEGAAQAWLGGPGSVGKTERKDVFGTSVGDYGRRFMSAYGGSGQEVASLDPSAGMSQQQTATQAIEAQAPTQGGTLSDEVAEFRKSPEYLAAFPGQQQAPAQQAPQPQPQAPAQEVAQAGPMQPPQQSGPSLPQLYEALQNPWLNDGQRALVESEIQRQQQMADPARQLQMDYQRAQIDALKAKPQTQWQKLDDDTLFNPETGETRSAGGAAGGNQPFRFSGSSVEAQSLNGLIESGQLTPGQAQQLGAGKTVTAPDGSIMFMTPQGVFSQPGGAQAPGSTGPVPSQGGNVLTREPMPQPMMPGAPSSAGAPINAVPQAGSRPATPAANGMIRLTEPKNNAAQISAEMGARIGMGDAFLKELPGIREKIARGDASGPIDGAKLAIGVGAPMDIWRDIETGRDALVRNLTGAGMSVSEANNQAARYQISPTDTSETMLSKLDNLERDLRATRSGAIDARTGELGEAPASGGDPLAAARAAIAKGAPRDKVIERLRQSGINPEGL